MGRGPDTPPSTRTAFVSSPSESKGPLKRPFLFVPIGEVALAPGFHGSRVETLRSLFGGLGRDAHVDGIRSLDGDDAVFGVDLAGLVVNRSVGHGSQLRLVEGLTPNGPIGMRVSLVAPAERLLVPAKPQTCGP